MTVLPAPMGTIGSKKGVSPLALLEHILTSHWVPAEPVTQVVISALVLVTARSVLTPQPPPSMDSAEILAEPIVSPAKITTARNALKDLSQSEMCAPISALPAPHPSTASAHAPMASSSTIPV